MNRKATFPPTIMHLLAVELLCRVDVQDLDCKLAWWVINRMIRSTLLVILG